MREDAHYSYKIILNYKVTDASVHDSNVFEDILDGNNTSRDVYADSAYRSAGSEAALKEGRFRAHLQRKGGFPEKRPMKCRLFQSRRLEKEESKS